MNNWETVIWKDVLTIQNGKNQKKVANSNGRYPIYGSGGIIGYADEYLCKAKTTIIGRKGSINNPLYVKENFWNVDTAFGLCAGERLDNKFLYYFCVTYDFLRHNRATTLPSLTKSDLLQIKIPLPSLVEQKKIAAILDIADQLRQKDQQLIDHYTHLSQSLFLEMFGDPTINPNQWKNKILGDICGVGSSRRVFKKELVNQGIPFYRGTEVGALGEDIMIKPHLFITKEHYNMLKKESGVPKEGDLLLPSICPDGRIFLVQDLQPFYFKDGRVLWIKVDKLNIDSVYLKSLLKKVFHSSYTNIASGTTFAELKIFTLKKIKILLPPIELQNQFAQHIEKIEQQKQYAQASLEKSEILFNSLLQQAFKGELTQSHTL
jgi:type I restriction enzyme S subunit